MKQIILILFTFAGITVNAQRLETEKILKVSDSILLARTNKHIFEWYDVSDGSYYEYQRKGNYYTGKFLSKKRLKRNATSIWVLSYLVHPEVSAIRGGTWIRLNRDLQLIDSIDLDFIPDFIWKGQSSNFISKQKALQLAIGYFEKSGIMIYEPILEYSNKFKGYTYQISNVLSRRKNEIGGDAGETEIVTINAVSGELLDRFEGAYGILVK